MTERQMNDANSGGSDNENSEIRRQTRRLSRLLLALLTGALILYVLVLKPMPYYIMTTGSAEELRPMVKVQPSDRPERGTFMLTTVSVMEANVSAYLWAKVTHEEIVPAQNVRQQGESSAEYDQREQYVMLTSQANAVQAAYRKLGIPYHIGSHGVMVLRTVPGMPAAKVLQTGDTVVSVDGRSVAARDDLLQGLAGKKEGDVVRLGLIRGSKPVEKEVAIGVFPDSEAAGSKNQTGLGIVTGDVQSVESDDPARQVTVKAGDIGGPSAGLMFSLEIYNQLQPNDITKGYRIAGTGEITPDGSVGVIGGIKHKVVAADRQKADFFFAPKDYTDADGNRYPNASDAQAKADAIGTKMKVVPVGTMQEALDYLAALPPKASSTASS